jgi:hypothetical protein
LAVCLPSEFQGGQSALVLRPCTAQDLCQNLMGFMSAPLRIIIAIFL